MTPHPEVVNELPKILIVGFGNVGQHLAEYFPSAHYVDADNVVRSVKTRCAVVPDAENYDLGFICVPTPEGEDGCCDLSIVWDAWNLWGERARAWCLKSTVEPGTTARLGERVCFSPEYLGETVGHPLTHADRETFVILGGPRWVTQAFADLWTLVTNSYTRIYQTDSKTAELVKLMENSWIATKVAFCNQFYDIANMAGVDWHELRELWLADPRVSRSHTYVYPQNRGFGGKCLPKDTANLCSWARWVLCEPASLIEAVRAYNARLRLRSRDCGR